MSSKLTEQIMLLTRKGLSTRQIAEILNTTMNNVAVLRSKHRKRAGTQVRGYNRVIPPSDTYQKPIHRLPPSEDEIRSLTGSSLNF